MGNVLAIANQKGGVGKTTTAVNLGASVADAGYPTLLVDLDPQCNATVALGPAEGQRPQRLRLPRGDAHARRRGAPQRASSGSTSCPPRPTSPAPTSSCPASPARRRCLRDALGERARRATCSRCSTARRRSGRSRSTRSSPPTSVIVPVQTEYFALEGLAELLDTLSLIQRELNPRLTVSGMILTMHDGRTRLARDVEREVREHFPELVFDTVVPRNVRLGEAPSFGVPVLAARAAQRRQSAAYLKLAKEVALVAEASVADGTDRRGASDMGRGLRGDPAARRQGSRTACARSRSDLIEPEPAPAAADLRRVELAELAESIRTRGVLQPIVVRPLAGGTLSSSSRASAACARRGSAELETDPRARARHRGLGAARPRPRREHGARRTSTRSRRRAPARCSSRTSGSTKEEVGRRVGRSRVAISNLDPPARPARGGARADRGRRPQRGPRPRDPALQGPRRRGAGWPARARDGGWSVRETERRAREAAGSPTRARACSPRWSTRISPRRWPRRRTRSRRRSAAT